jgi:benzoate membrane transport protein
MVADSVAGLPDRHARFPLQAITSGLTIALLHVAGLSILLAAAGEFALSASETTTLIVGIHGLTALLSAGLTFLFRLPLIVGLNATSLFFIISLATTYSYQEVMGGVGALVVLVALLGLSARLTALIPAPIVFGTVAGAVLPFVVGIFTDMATEPAMIGLTVLAFLLARRFLPVRVPAVLPALIVGALVALFSGKLQGARDPWSLPTLATSGPVFSWQALVAIAPIVAILIAVNANLASIIYLRSQGYHPPERGINVATGIATMAGGCFGAMPISMGTFLLPLVAGPEGGEPRQRSWGPYAAAAGMLVIVLFAGIAAQVPAMIPATLLLAIAGLVLVAVLAQMLGGAIAGPLRLGPLFAFAVAASDMSLWGFGSAFWALVIGMIVTLLLEPRELAAVRLAATGTA